MGRGKRGRGGRGEEGKGRKRGRGGRGEGEEEGKKSGEREEGKGRKRGRRVVRGEGEMERGRNDMNWEKMRVDERSLNHEIPT